MVFVFATAYANWMKLSKKNPAAGYAEDFEEMRTALNHCMLFGPRLFHQQMKSRSKYVKKIIAKIRKRERQEEEEDSSSSSSSSSSEPSDSESSDEGLTHTQRKKKKAKQKAMQKKKRKEKKKRKKKNRERAKKRAKAQREKFRSEDDDQVNYKFQALFQCYHCFSPILTLHICQH